MTRVGDDLAVAQSDDAAGVRGDFVLVGDDHDGASVGVEVVEDAHHFLGRCRVECAGRFVGKDQRRVGGDRSGDRDALLLSTRELRRCVLDPIGQSDEIQRLEGQAPPLGFRHLGVDEREFDVGQCARARNEVERLEHEPDASVADARKLVVVERADIDAVEEEPTSGGDVEASDDVHHRRLAASGGAHDGNEFAPLDHQRDVAQRSYFGVPCAEDLVDPVEDQDRPLLFRRGPGNGDRFVEERLDHRVSPRPASRPRRLPRLRFRYPHRRLHPECWCLHR